MTAASVDQHKESETAAYHTRSQASSASQDSHTCLTANSMLASVQGDLTTSNKSSPTPCHGPHSRFQSVLCCAVPALASPAITPRLMVCSHDLDIARFGVQSISAQKNLAHTRERVNELTERLAVQARARSSADGIHHANVGTMLLQQVSFLTAKGIACVMTALYKLCAVMHIAVMLVSVGQKAEMQITSQICFNG